MIKINRRIKRIVKAAGMNRKPEIIIAELTDDNLYSFNYDDVNYLMTKDELNEFERENRINDVITMNWV